MNITWSYFRQMILDCTNTTIDTMSSKQIRREMSDDLYQSMESDIKALKERKDNILNLLIKVDE